MRLFAAALVLSSLCRAPAVASPISTAFPFSPGFSITKVSALAESLPSHSWELGTAAQALLELYDPALAVFGRRPFPVPTLNKDVVRSLAFAAEKIIIGTGPNGLADGDGAVGDPASLGVSAVLLGKTEKRFGDAAREEVEYILEGAPRFWNGAISHRVAVAELWADFIYMAPPFLAYYAADTGNTSLLLESVRQCGLYREILQANVSSRTPYNGVWEHIIGPLNEDTGLWSTGNAWAAAGMARVLATVIKAPLAHHDPHASPQWREGAINDLTSWIKEILDGAMGAPPDDGLLRNYLNNTDTHGFGEISGSALLASVAYRMVVLCPEVFGSRRYGGWADGVRRVLGGRDASGEAHVTQNGTVTPAVNPLGWGDTVPWTAGSPEGQNFVVLMYAAWRDCVFAGKCALYGGWRND